MTPNSSNPNWTPQPELPLLRQKVDQIDLSLLGLLKERSVLSRQIGMAKKEKNAPVYAPEREQEVMARLLKHNGGEIEPRVLRAIYREILAGSRQAQSPPAVGFIGQDLIYWAARAQIGQAERLVKCKGWMELAKGIKEGEYSFGLLPGTRLSGLLGQVPDAEKWVRRWVITGLYDTKQAARGEVETGVFSLGLRATHPETRQLRNRILLLIRCKTPEDAVNKLQLAMAESFTAFHTPVKSADPDAGAVLAQLTVSPQLLPELVSLVSQTAQSLHLPHPIVLGAYWYGEDYGG